MSNNLQPALDVIKAFEGIMDGNPKTVNLDPYLCPADYWTIGWGHVVLDSLGKQIKGAANKKLAYSMYPNGITMLEAEVLLADDIRRFSSGIHTYVKVPLTNNQFCALVSFSFNVGMGSFKGSTLLRLLNANQLDQVPSQLIRWNKGAGKVLPGLVARRAAEVKLWNS